MKTCITCKVEKSDASFGIRTDRPSTRSYCKTCGMFYQRKYRKHKKEVSMSELISSKQIAEEFKLSASIVCNYLEVAKIPAHKLMVGSEAVSLYDKAGAFKAVEGRVKEEKAIAALHLAKLEAAKIPTLKEVMTAIKSIALDISDVAELQQEISRLTTANQGLYKVLTEFKADTAEALAGLKVLIVNLRDEVKSKARPAPDIARIKVAVVGVLTLHHPALDAEFGELMNLKMLDPNDIRGIHNLRGYDKVFLMKKTTDFKHSEQIKAVKVSPEVILGSVDELKEKLTAYYLSQ